MESATGFEPPESYQGASVCDSRESCASNGPILCSIGGALASADRPSNLPPTSFAPPGTTFQGAATEPPPRSSEIAERAQRLVANQHRDDEARKQYERIERHTDLTGGQSRTIQDGPFGVVPTGTGTLKILLKENGIPTDPIEYRRRLQASQDVLR